MNKRFYISIFVILTLTVVILSATYSKDSGTSEYTSISKELENLKITYENGELLKVSRVNKLGTSDLKGSNISVVNKSKNKVNVLIELNYPASDDIYYSIDNSDMKLIGENAKEVISLNEFGVEGDSKLFNIKVFSLKDVSDKVDIKISTLDAMYLKYYVVNSEQVYKDKDGNYIYYGKPNNYIKYDNKIYRIIGLFNNNKFKLVSFNNVFEEYNAEKSYIQMNDFIKTFNNREIDETNMDLFDSWVKEYNDFWFKDSSAYTNNTIVYEGMGQHYASEVLEISDYVLLNGGDGSQGNPYEVKYGN